MKKNNKLIKITILLLISSMFLVGCGGSSSSKTVELVIIAGKHANAAVFSEEMKRTAGDLIEKSIESGKEGNGYYEKANVSVVISDGNPEAIDIDDDIIYKIAPNSRYNKVNIANMKNEIMDFLNSDSVMANDEEVDLLGALSVARSILRRSNADEKYILILDTGITTKTLDMTNIDMLSSDVNSIISCIDEDGLCDLTGVKVEFLGLGRVGGTQKVDVSNSKLKDKLEELWETIIYDKLNADKVSNIVFYDVKTGESQMVYNETAENGYPYVSNVNLVGENNNVLDITSINVEAGTTEKVEEKIAVVLETQDLGFKGDSWEFRDGEVQAQKTLNGYAGAIEAFLNDNSSNKIYIVGSIAKKSVDDREETSNLSLNRAIAVKDLLLKMGVPEDRIEVIDAGTRVFSWRNNNEYPDGKTLDLDAQQKNRVVAIIGSTSTELVNEILSAPRFDY